MLIAVDKLGVFDFADLFRSFEELGLKTGNFFASTKIDCSLLSWKSSFLNDFYELSLN